MNYEHLVGKILSIISLVLAGLGFLFSLISREEI